MGEMKSENGREDKLQVLGNNRISQRQLITSVTGT